MVMQIASGGRLEIQSGGRMTSGPDPSAGLWDNVAGWTRSDRSSIYSTGNGEHVVGEFYKESNDTGFVLFGDGENNTMRAQVIDIQGPSDAWTNNTAQTLAPSLTGATFGGMAPAGTNRYVNIYNSFPGTGDIDGQILTVSGLTFSQGTDQTNLFDIGTQFMSDMVIMSLSDTKHIAVWKENNDNSLQGGVFVTDGTTASITTAGAANATTVRAAPYNGFYVRMLKLDSTRVLVYVTPADATATNYQDIELFILENPSGTTLNVGTPSVISVGGTFPDSPLMALVDSSTVFLTYRTSSTETSGRFLTIGSGTTISSTGTPSTFISGEKVDPGAGGSTRWSDYSYCQVTSNEWMFAYRSDETGGLGAAGIEKIFARVVKFDGASYTLGDRFQIDVPSSSASKAYRATALYPITSTRVLSIWAWQDGSSLGDLYTTEIRAPGETFSP